MTDWRKAVELADGWEVCPEGFTEFRDENGVHWTPGAVDSLPQWAKDAIAAQLVRQVEQDKQRLVTVDYNVDKYGVSLPSEGYFVYIGGIGADFIRECEPYSDRSENTVNAILDSGVLE